MGSIDSMAGKQSDGCDPEDSVEAIAESLGQSVGSVVEDCCFRPPRISPCDRDRS